MTATAYNATTNTFVISALDSVVAHHCRARDGGRVDMPVLFTGSGFHVRCPYCDQPV